MTFTCNMLRMIDIPGFSPGIGISSAMRSTSLTTPGASEFPDTGSGGKFLYEWERPLNRLII